MHDTYIICTYINSIIKIIKILYKNLYETIFRVFFVWLMGRILLFKWDSLNGGCI